ncbi:MAG: 23S rRNA (uracil(1939)-C(5))-methyltransferase RlmD [Bacteroidales bacterium]
MRRKQKELPLLEHIEIVDLAAEGKAIARVSIGKDEKRDFIVFVDNCVPGDVVDVKVKRKQKNFMEGIPVKFHRYSETRIEPRCRHFGVCGGCKWQSLPYPVQLDYKQKQVTDQFRHLGKFEMPEPEEILASENEYFYRNKLEFTFSDKRWLISSEIDDGLPKDLDALGFHIPGKFDKVLDIQECFLQPQLSDKIRLAVKKFAKENGLSFYNLREEKGFLRNLIIRNTLAGEWMVVVSFFYDDKAKREILLDFIAKEFKEVSSLLYVINPKKNDTLTDLSVSVYKGNGFIAEKMEELEFRIGPKSFYQTNPEQAYRLYCLARDYAQLTGNETVYDLYTGTGTIANFIAKKAQKVIGIEYVEEAVADARENSKLNGIGNTTFFSGDMKNVLNREFILKNGKPDVMIIDPPRAGMHPDVVQAVLFAAPQRIVYVSCNAATQARDIQMLSENYKLVKFRPVDMFPQTAHVENIALLERKERD